MADGRRQTRRERPVLVLTLLHQASSITSIIA
jgi:hypothetical protein